jgi:hypothetical protein
MGSGDEVVQGQYNGYESTMTFAAQQPSDGDVPFNGRVVLNVGIHSHGDADDKTLVPAYEPHDAIWGVGHSSGVGVVGVGGLYETRSHGETIVAGGPGIVGLGGAEEANIPDRVGEWFSVLHYRGIEEMHPNKSLGVYGNGDIGIYGRGTPNRPQGRTARGGAFETFTEPARITYADGSYKKLPQVQQAQVRLVPHPHMSYEVSFDRRFPPPVFSPSLLPKDGMSGDLIAITSQAPRGSEEAALSDIVTTLWFCVKGIDDPTLEDLPTQGTLIQKQAVWGQVQLTNFLSGQG